MSSFASSNLAAVGVGTRVAFNTRLVSFSLVSSNLAAVGVGTRVAFNTRTRLHPLTLAGVLCCVGLFFGLFAIVCVRARSRVSLSVDKFFTSSSLSHAHFRRGPHPRPARRVRRAEQLILLRDLGTWFRV